jgi:hypothetical protein
MDEIQDLYTLLKKTSNGNLGHPSVTEIIIQIAIKSADFLRPLSKIKAVSNVPDKNYFFFQNGIKKSRPVNLELFITTISDRQFDMYRQMNFAGIGPDEVDSILYTIGQSFCLTRDIIGSQDKKSPSVFFEIFIGNIFSRLYNTNPSTQIKIDLEPNTITLPTDYIFHPPNSQTRIHLPIKLSTRERSVQSWAHQRVLEGISGVDRYKGIMVVMTETNYVGRNNSVVEVCLPDQWRLYQMYISKMKRIYYLDIPEKYTNLHLVYPFIQVKPFSLFFSEYLAILGNATD